MEPETRADASGLPIRPLPDGSDVRKCTAADLTDVVPAVARSFYEDPIFRWILPDDGRRLSQLERGFALFARRVWFPQDETYTTDKLIGGAFWMPPGTWHLSLFKQLSMLPAMAVILRGELPRLLRVLNAIESRHPHDRHYYLPVIGIGPEWQGAGSARLCCGPSSSVATASGCRLTSRRRARATGRCTNGTALRSPRRCESPTRRRCGGCGARRSRDRRRRIGDRRRVTTKTEPHRSG
jgi:hypothetical protein